MNERYAWMRLFNLSNKEVVIIWSLDAQQRRLEEKWTLSKRGALEVEISPLLVSSVIQIVWNGPTTNLMEGLLGFYESMAKTGRV